MKTRRFAAALASLTLGAALAQPLALPAPAAAALDPHPGAVLPLDAPLRDDLNQPVRLGSYFSPGQPVLLVVGYYSCTQLCGLLMQGLLEALRDTGLPRTGWRIVGVSLDPADTAQDAQRRRALDLAYAAFLDGAHASPTPLHLDLLVGDAASVRRIAQAAGIGYQAVSPQAAGSAPVRAFAHPATVLVVTPSGRVSRYFNGVHFDADALRGALLAAAGGEVGSLSERFALLCAHFDPVVGRHSATVLDALRLTGGLTLLGLAALAWRHRTRGRRP